MEILWMVITKVIHIFMFLLLGYISVRKRIFSEKGLAEMTQFLLRVVTPCLIANSFRTIDAEKVNPVTLFWAVALPAVSVLLNIAVSHLFFRKEETDRQKVLRFSIVFCNAGFMGLPLIESIVGSEGIFYGAFFVAVTNIFMWTYGIRMMGAENAGLKNIILNPGVIGLCLGLPLCLLHIELPQLISVPVEMLAAINTPLAMVIVGGYIVHIKFRTSIRDISVYKMALVRLIAAPALCLIIILAGYRNSTFVLSSIIQVSTPVAANSVLFAVQYGRDMKLASQCVAVTSLLSMFTIPLLVILAQMFV